MGKLLKLKNQFKSIFNNLKYYLMGIYQIIDNDNLFLMASAITFNILTCVIPLIFIIFAVVGNILSYEVVQDKIFNFVENLIPYQSTARYIEQIIEERVREFVAFKNTAGWIGGVGLFITASSLFNTLSVVLNKTYEIEVKKSFIYVKLRDVLLIILVILLLAIYILIIPIIELFLKIIKLLPFVNIFYIPIINSFFIYSFSFIIVLGIFYIIFTVIPHKLLPAKVRLISAFYTTFFWLVAKFIFGYYLIKFATFSRIYGTYAVFIIVIFWIYYSSMILIIGAAIGHLYKNRISH